MTALLNLTSLMLGFISLGIPLWAIARKKYSFLCCGGSFLCCALSLLLQLVEVNNRVNLGDLAAVMDTICAVVLAGTALLLFSTGLNLLAFFRNRK